MLSSQSALTLGLSFLNYEISISLYSLLSKFFKSDSNPLSSCSSSPLAPPAAYSPSLLEVLAVSSSIPFFFFFLFLRFFFFFFARDASD
jgi:hypothetical protein